MVFSSDEEGNPKYFSLRSRRLSSLQRIERDVAKLASSSARISGHFFHEDNDKANGSGPLHSSGATSGRGGGADGADGGPAASSSSKVAAFVTKTLSGFAGRASASVRGRKGTSPSSPSLRTGSSGAEGESPAASASGGNDASPAASSDAIIATASSPSMRSAMSATPSPADGSEGNHSAYGATRAPSVGSNNTSGSAATGGGDLSPSSNAPAASVTAASTSSSASAARRLPPEVALLATAQLPEPPYTFPAGIGLFAFVLEPHYSLEVLQYVCCAAAAVAVLLLSDAAAHHRADEVAQHQGRYEEGLRRREAALQWDAERRAAERRAEGRRLRSGADSSSSSSSSPSLSLSQPLPHPLGEGGEGSSGRPFLQAGGEGGSAVTIAYRSFVMRPSPLWGGDFAEIIYGAEGVTGANEEGAGAVDGIASAGEQLDEGPTHSLLFGECRQSSAHPNLFECHASRFIPRLLRFLCSLASASPFLSPFVSNDADVCAAVVLQPLAASALRAAFAAAPTLLLMLFSFVNLNATAAEHRAFWRRVGVAVPRWNLIPFIA